MISEDTAIGPPKGRSSSRSRRLGAAILTILGLLTVEVLFEGWAVTRFGEFTIDAAGNKVFDGANWPKALKSALYGVLLILTIAKFFSDDSWRRLRTRADFALAAVCVVMLIAGLAGGSSLVLIGQGIFVYFRGVIVFYAIRALNPSWRQLRPLVWVGGGFLVLNSIFAVWQFFAGLPAYRALGWVDPKWAVENRAQGLLDHPNDLGHLTGLMLLGLMAWFMVAEKVKKRWWVLFCVIAATLAIAQSRQSTLACLIALAVMWLLHRANTARLVAGALVVLVAGALPLALSPENRAQLLYRLGGTINATQMDSDKDGRLACAQDPDCAEVSGEIRVLFAKQGGTLLVASPLLGYGVGQFGGIVAEKEDPDWNLDPRFVEVLGPDGFFLHGFQSVTVDVFWLHLLVEVGVVGLLAYLAWLLAIASPIMRAARRRQADGQPRGTPQEQVVVLWAAATIVFAVLIAAWSPALEDPLFPPLMFGILGLGWVMVNRRAGSVPSAGQGTVRAGKRSEGE